MDVVECPPPPASLASHHTTTTTTGTATATATATTTAFHKRSRSDSASETSRESVHSTRTLTSDDLDFIHENGRVYGNSCSYMPCDEVEQTRLAILHQVFLHALKGRLTTTEVTQATQRILDVGSGPGHWAIAMSQQYPHAEVVGIDMAVWDLDMTEAEMGANNVHWEIDDLDIWGVESDIDSLTSRLRTYDPFRDRTEPLDSPSKRRQKSVDPDSSNLPTSPTDSSFDPFILDPERQPGWHFSHAFDLIHVRNMRGIFSDWENFYAEVYRNLAPGGWVEMVDYDVADFVLLHPTSKNGSQSSSFYEGHVEDNNVPFPTTRRIVRSMMQASFKFGRPFGTFYLHPSYLTEAGFKDVRTTYVNVPIGQWPEDEEQARIGKMLLVVLLEGLESQVLRLLTSVGDDERVWSADEVRSEIEKSHAEVQDWFHGRSKAAAGMTWCAQFKWVVGRKSKHG